MKLPKTIFKDHLNERQLQSKNKDDLIEYILHLQWGIGHIAEALVYIEQDLEKIRIGDALHVHDNP